MSPFSKDKMSPMKGTESGQITTHERNGIEPVGSDAAASRETADAERSGRDAGCKCQASQTVAEAISAGWSRRAGEPTAWEGEQSSDQRGGQAKSVRFSERKISWVWADVSLRKAGGGGRLENIG